MRLSGCAGWSVPLMFANPEDRFFRVEAHIISYWERSSSVVECLTRDRGFEPHQRHCVVSLSKIH